MVSRNKVNELPVNTGESLLVTTDAKLGLKDVERNIHLLYMTHPDTPWVMARVSYASAHIAKGLLQNVPCQQV